MSLSILSPPKENCYAGFLEHFPDRFANQTRILFGMDGASLRTAPDGLLWACRRPRAQVTASLSGKITDPSGAAVASAPVTVRNVNTGAERSDTTNAVGVFQISSLPVGEYEVDVKQSGFAEAVRTGIHLAVGQAAAVDIQLHVGDVNQQVVVHADAPLVNVNTGDISGLVGERQIQNLPLNGRSYDQLLTLNPGIVNFTSEKTGGDRRFQFHGRQ